MSLISHTQLLFKYKYPFPVHISCVVVDLIFKILSVKAETTEVAGSTVTPRQSAVAVRNLSAEFVADEAERSCNLPQVRFPISQNVIS